MDGFSTGMIVSPLGDEFTSLLILSNNRSGFSGSLHVQLLLDTGAE